MDPHPEPSLASRKLPLFKLRNPVFRVHHSTADPLLFSCRCIHRFDPPDAGYGVLYAGEDVFCAFIETLGHRTGQNIVEERDLRVRSVTTIEPNRELHLVDLRGPGLAKIGADARLCAGDYPISQKWSAAFFLHEQKPDGICYPARHDPSKFAVALFDRSGKVLRATTTIVLWEHPMLSRILNHYGFGLV